MADDFERRRDEQRTDPDANEPWQIVKQTEGLDADEIRRVAGPDWQPGTQGDLEVETGESRAADEGEETERTL